MNFVSVYKYSYPNHSDKIYFRKNPSELLGCNNAFSNRIKNACIKSVKSSKPYEKAFIVDYNNSKIIKFANGNRKSVNIDAPKTIFTKHNYSMVHSHPSFVETNGDKYSLPVSFSDFEYLNANKNIREITAINENGVETTLRKKDSYQKLSQEEISKVRYSFFETLFNKLCSNTEKDKIIKLHEYSQKNPNSTSIKQNIIDKILNKQYSKNGSEAIKNFWEENCNKINLDFIF